MQTKSSTALAGIACVVASLCLFGAAYLVFVFPCYLNEWKDRGEPLPGALQFVADLSHFIKKFGLLVIPSIATAVAVSARWFAGTLQKTDDGGHGQGT